MIGHNIDETSLKLDNRYSITMADTAVTHDKLDALSGSTIRAVMVSLPILTRQAVMRMFLFITPLY